MQPTMSPADLAHATRLIKRGEQVNLRELLGHLVDLGYESAALVEEPGKFSHRGGIVDFFPPTSNLPIRIEFFGDEIDSIRLFNPLTQRSEGQAEGVLITPSCEMPLWKREQAAAQLKEIDTSNLREEVLEEWNDQLQMAEAGECFEGMELSAPYYTQPLASLADYLTLIQNSKLKTQHSVPPLLVLDDPELIRLEAAELERQAAELYKGFIDNGELPPGLARPYLTWEEVTAHGRGLPILSIGGGAEGAIEAPAFTPTKLYAGNIPNVITELKRKPDNKTRHADGTQEAALPNTPRGQPPERKHRPQKDAGRQIAHRGRITAVLPSARAT